MYDYLKVLIRLHTKEQLLEYKEFLINHVAKANNPDHCNWMLKNEISKLDSVRKFPANFLLSFNDNKLIGLTRIRKVMASNLNDLITLLLIKKL